jgi:hypothetical protein
VVGMGSIPRTSSGTVPFHRRFAGTVLKLPTTPPAEMACFLPCWQVLAALPGRQLDLLQLPLHRWMSGNTVSPCCHDFLLIAHSLHHVLGPCWWACISVLTECTKYLLYVCMWCVCMPCVCTCLLHMRACHVLRTMYNIRM